MSKTAKEGVSLTKFGEILMQLRQEKHLSQAELGHIIYVSGGTISNYEKGVHYPDVEKLVRLADYFNVSIDYLLGRSTSKLSPDVFASPPPSPITSSPSRPPSTTTSLMPWLRSSDHRSDRLNSLHRACTHQL